MKRVLLVFVVLALAGCGGTHNTKKPGVKPSRPVTKPLGRPLVVQLRGTVTGTAQVRSQGNKQMSVSLKIANVRKGLTAELDKGSCAAPKGLQLAKPLGAVRAASSSWLVLASLTQLTASPLAVVLRSNGKVVGCGNVRQA
jgi:hypothetical protein